MFTNVQALTQATDGRYASDQELMFFQRYLSSVGIRLRAYQKIQGAEQQIISQVLTRLKVQRPDIFLVGGQDLAAKWQRDTVRVLRYSATALLLDDSERFKDTLLLWFQTIMRAFGAQESCNLTYTAMQEVMAQHLNGEELILFLPILELSRMTLGGAITTFCITAEG
ncbi:phycobilisome protein [Leptolyngbya sp. CCNP1308]|uniref:phycobilisome protein n=1 Tax=Leptolyngbya sp. CCNP1308 TaxID=3110255 RepID=UPI002B2076CD|nr:phycobilisome protein [Leptolyngbya sp. CCNP1308]MEA5452908.1 phycobilisome protein [Leptolyngbya sp. CCNP1308]